MVRQLRWANHSYFRLVLISAPFIAYHPIYAHPLPEGHRFPMIKYELIPEQLIYEGSIDNSDIFSPESIAEDILMLTHDASYWQRMKDLALSDREMRAIGFPLSAKLVERELRICEGTVRCAEIALAGGIALNVAGGTHHAFADRGEGFCLLNDFAIAANYLLHHRRASKILIIDLDVHQGNGTAKLFEGEPQVFTFSMHGQQNYPFRKEYSDLDIGLPDGVSGAEYLAILRAELPRLLDAVEPEVVFYLPGVDVLATDKFGRMKLSIAECRERDQIVFSECLSRRLGVAVAMGGGYSHDIRHIVEAHCNTFRLAAEFRQATCHRSI